MDIVNDAMLWLTDPENWAGAGSIPVRTLEHLTFTALAVLVAAIIAVPLGYYIGHTGRGRVLAVGTAGAARALPTFGLMLYLVLIFGVSERATAATVALVLLAIPPLLAGAYAGVDQINRATIDAAKAQGMTDWQILTRVEIPLSLPLLIGGVRGATLQVVATVTLIAYVGLGGLGYDIIQGIPLRRLDQMVGAALLIIALALVIDGLLAVLTRLATPHGVSTGRGVDVRAREKRVDRSGRLSPATRVTQ